MLGTQLHTSGCPCPSTSRARQAAPQTRGRSLVAGKEPCQSEDLVPMIVQLLFNAVKAAMNTVLTKTSLLLETSKSTAMTVLQALSTNLT